ncbi:MAG TPA: hypothetical protein VHY48_07660 [Acidobacteriaceae bacterium]|jgi:hypothetical protein|nr:hypothetical protein [Acidobacteriaceae bacterium]
MNQTLKRLSGVACTAALLSLTGLAVAQRPQDQNHGGQHFRDQDRSHLQQHYGTQAHQWANRSNRPHFAVGAAIPRTYHLQPVPSTYWEGNPPPPGCNYAYYDGYVVCYNPATRVINDLIDLATGQ